ncbi:MAG TPA: pentapeptide repeat-containing protein [Acidimicrobiales bacterium]|nr:pentapeptide repeat-containing protein [Acidimicrobiales bacterium]
MKSARLVLVAALGAIGLSSCGAAVHANTPFVASKNCTIRATNVDYAGCDLAHYDLKGLDLSSDNFRRANMSDANLDGANIQGADLRGAKTVGIITNSSTVCVNAKFGPCTQPSLRSVSR